MGSQGSLDNFSYSVFSILDLVLDGLNIEPSSKVLFEIALAESLLDLHGIIASSVACRCKGGDGMRVNNSDFKIRSVGLLLSFISLTAVVLKHLLAQGEIGSDSRGASDQEGCSSCTSDKPARTLGSPSNSLRLDLHINHVSDCLISLNGHLVICTRKLCKT